jgi:hypothetical protein
MKGMSVPERNEYVAALQSKREMLQKKIAGLHNEREQFVADKLKNQATLNTLDSAIIHALRRQAALKNFIIKNNRAGQGS